MKRCVYTKIDMEQTEKTIHLDLQSGSPSMEVYPFEKAEMRQNEREKENGYRLALAFCRFKIPPGWRILILYSKFDYMLWIPL